jgi:hypothetical protein
VPEPDISLHFLIQPLKTLNQALKALMQSLARKLDPGPPRLPVRQNFSSEIMSLAAALEARAKPQEEAKTALFGAGTNPRTVGGNQGA